VVTSDPSFLPPMFCDNFLDLTVSHPFHVNVIRLLIGILYLIMMNVTVIWIYIQKRNAMAGDNMAVESVIFPLFINIMWILAASDFLIGILIIFLPINLDGDHPISTLALVLYPIGFTSQHAVIEGVAFLLLQKGCGYYGSLKAGQYTMIWSLVTLVVMTLRYAQIPILSNLVYLLWCFSLVLFYFFIWFLPSKYLYRRSAVVPYAKFWCLYRLLMLIFLLLISLHSLTSSDLSQSIGYCGYDFIYLLFYPLIHPLVLYRTLLNDSR
jgi:hypothetical protein